MTTVWWYDKFRRIAARLELAVTTDGERLFIRPGRDLPPEFVQSVRKRKWAIIEQLELEAWVVRVGNLLRQSDGTFKEWPAGLRDAIDAEWV